MKKSGGTGWSAAGRSYGTKVEYEVRPQDQPIIMEVYDPQLSERLQVGDQVCMTLIDGCVRVLK